MKKRNRKVNYNKHRLDKLKFYDKKNIITRYFLQDEFPSQVGEEMLYRNKYAKYVTNPDSYYKG